MIEINSDNLLNEYAVNEQDANGKYSGKKVKITGELFFIGESHTGIPMLLFKSPEGIRLQLGAYFKGAWGDKKDLLIEGIPTTVEGIIKEKTYGDFIKINGEIISNFGFTIIMK
ncbi:OB-fold protein [Flavivirga jejuensis]|uniref:Uncharacterized protein n=1 Tax=Flavivirga jejuensis TaxID=870487 RepID=A0ABT8WRH0_9FLAO|nr:hypothetical protein [Flavivirga jejuensis]MDO5975507.1 hypothetical protein [Flavivirga jejuensis]